MFYKKPEGGDASKGHEFRETGEKQPEKFEYDPALKVHARDAMIANLLKREFKSLARKEAAQNLRFLFVGIGSQDEWDVSLTRGWKVPPEYVEFIEATGARAHFLDARGYDAQKKNAEKYVADESSDVVIVLDEDIEATHKFLKNVKRKGYLICRTDMATGALRSEKGKFEFKGVLTVSGDRWKHVESKEYDVVQDDAQFQEAQNVKDAVSYEEAKRTLERFGRSTNNVLGEYQKLVDEILALDENKSAVENGETIFTFKDEHSGKTVSGINTVLPRVNGNDEDICILQRMR